MFTDQFMHPPRSTKLHKYSKWLLNGGFFFLSLLILVFLGFEGINPVLQGTRQSAIGAPMPYTPPMPRPCNPCVPCAPLSAVHHVPGLRPGLVRVLLEPRWPVCEDLGAVGAVLQMVLGRVLHWHRARRMRVVPRFPVAHRAPAGVSQGGGPPSPWPSCNPLCSGRLSSTGPCRGIGTAAVPPPPHPPARARRQQTACAVVCRPVVLWPTNTVKQER